MTNAQLIQASFIKQAAEGYRRPSEARRELLNGRRYPFSYLTGEAKELVDAIKNRDKENIKEEIGDVLYAMQMLAHQSTGLDAPFLPPAQKTTRKFHKRRSVWKDILARKGLEFSNDYLEGGSNYRKPEKIRKAIQAAGSDITDEELEDLEELVGGYEVPVR